VLTDPEGLSVGLTFSGSPDLPTGAGEYLVSAQIGEDNYQGSATATLTIARAGQAVTFSEIGDQTFGVGTFGLVADASSGLPVDLQVLSGPAEIDGLNLSVLGAGEITVRASQAGTGNYFPAVPVDRSFTVSPAGQTIDFPAIGTRTFGEPSLSLAATATSRIPVVFEIVSGPARVAGGVMTLTGAGSVTIRATQGGNADWLPAAPVEQTFAVEKQAQTIEFPTLDDRVFDSGEFGLIAGSDSGLVVGFEVVGGPATIDGAILTLTGVGTITVRASQAGDVDYLPAEAVEQTFISGYSLVLMAGSGGGLVATPPKPVYAPDEVVLISMSEEPDYRFTAWGGDLDGSEAPASLVMDGNKSVSAEFKHIWTLAVGSNTGGSVTVDPVKAEYLEGDTVTLTAVPETGYALEEWQVDATGTEDPLVITMTADTRVNAQFHDVAEPEIGIFSPTAGITNNQFAALFGSVADNDSVTSVRWERDGVDKGLLDVAGGLFSITGLVLNPGENSFRIFALDPAGNEGQGEVTISWQPDRTLSLVDPAEVREGKLVTVPIDLESLGNVGGMTLILSYEDAYLSDPQVLLTGPVATGINQINTDTPGEVRITFALPATTLPAGSLDLGQVTFRARSVPFNLTAEFGLDVLDVAGSDGNQIAFGTHTTGASVRILQRTATGDINTNDKLDTGDAFRMQRMIAGLDEIRSWDHVLNDLNGSALVDSGDVIRVLRTVVGLDPQPGAGAVPKSKGGPRAKDGHGASAKMVADQSGGDEGDQITVQVVLEDLGYAPSGASFTLDYPVDALRLTGATSHNPGALVPADSFVLWNVSPAQNDYVNQTGSVAFVASSSAAWADAQDGGVLAEFVFEVQAGAAAQASWPIRLRQVEVPSEDGFDILNLADSQIEFHGRATTFADWIGEHFEEGELGNDEITGHLADPDGDGCSNLKEYGMGTDPTDPQSRSQVTVERVSVGGGEAIAIGFQHSLTAVDVACHVERSRDLLNWERNDGETQVTQLFSAEPSESGQTERLVVHDLENALPGTRTFLRVAFELVEP
ncbi:MAG: InlB B-repeat-containing protein, partial [Verrucomicrobiales bacterium]